jgi:mannose-6-phosphate isomerase-like protein (cupin superfamily)
MSRTPPRVISLSEIEAVPGPGSLTWHPVRMTLGIKAFGCNAYTARAIGDDIVEPHTEAPETEAEREHPERMHEELYFVAAGRAKFTIDGVEYDAPAGTYVFIPDPDSHRHAVATEVPATVLSFGGPPTFEPSDWEWSFRAAPLMRSDPGQARQILEEGLRERPKSASLRYDLACLEALSGNREATLEALRTAVEWKPSLRATAAEDEDFVSLRDDEDFQSLIS